MSSDNSTKSTADVSAKNLSANNKAYFLLGRLEANTVRIHGENAATVYEQRRRNDPLPGEDLTDTSGERKLEEIIRFKSDHQKFPK